jgi:hypothetical protein
MQVLDGHISTYFNKDTPKLFMLCIMLICQSYSVLLLLFDLFCCCSLIHLSLFNFSSTFFSFDYFVWFNFHCSLQNIQFWSWIVFLVFQSHYPSWPSESINIIHQTAPSLSLYRSEWPITIIDIEGYTTPIFSKTKLAEGEAPPLNNRMCNIKKIS